MTANQSVSALVQGCLSGMSLCRILLRALAIGITMSLVPIMGCAVITESEVLAAGQQQSGVSAGFARQLAGGMFNHSSLLSVSPDRSGELLFAGRVRTLQYQLPRYSTDHLFAAGQDFHNEFKSTAGDGPTGQLNSSMGTAHHASAFFQEVGATRLASSLHDWLLPVCIQV